MPSNLLKQGQPQQQIFQLNYKNQKTQLPFLQELTYWILSYLQIGHLLELIQQVLQEWKSL